MSCSRSLRMLDDFCTGNPQDVRTRRDLHTFVSAFDPDRGVRGPCRDLRNPRHG
ncbi:MAG UNVERIFIED_CONTAM: hypothetical protein LVR18_40795 [Planctomycetaceae bacterium]